jgi:hypothetical protein
MYACGTAQTDSIAQIAITAGVMSATITAGPEVDNSGSYYPRCSAITEFDNANIATAATTATGSLDVAGTVSIAGGTSWVGQTVTVGTTTYTFETTITAVNQILLYHGGTGGGAAAANRLGTAENLRAVIDNVASECQSGGTPSCLFTGQTANSAVTHPSTLTTDTVGLTASTAGAAGDFTVTPDGANVTATSQNGFNASSSSDFLFLSAFASTESGCTNATTDGCVMSFNITNPSNWSGTTAPLGTLDIASPGLNTIGAGINPAAPTSGIIVDNNGTAGGESQIYFLTQNPSATTACTTGGADGVCAIQVSQSNP